MSLTRLIAATLISAVFGAAIGAAVFGAAIGVDLMASPGVGGFLAWALFGGVLVGSVTGFCAFLSGYIAWTMLRNVKRSLRIALTAGISALVGTSVVAIAELQLSPVNPMTLPALAGALILCVASVGAVTQGERCDRMVAQNMTGRAALGLSRV
ncbi:hypothetical protein [Mycetocola tolaasinivorans]|nr:hypothetical protein [Mycetocola tolaasinivorans]